MSFTRLALNSRAAVRHARRYATEASPSTPSPGKSSSNLPLYLGGAGLAGLSAYIYLSSGSNAPVAPKKVQEKSPLDPKAFIDFPLKKIEPYNHNTAKFVFELPNNDASLLPVASCVVVKSPDDAAQPLLDAKGKPVIRPYTPISPSDAQGELVFLVKKYEQGKMSKYFHDLKPGDKLAVKGPILKFPFKVNEFEEVGMIAGGSGITPMYQILDYALADKANKTKFTLIFANVEERDILLREEFDQLKKKHPDTFNVIYTLDKPSDNWTGYKGYVNSDLIQKHIAPASLADKVKVFICGPPGQVAAIAGKKDGMKQGDVGGILKELGYKEDQVFKF